MNLEEVKQLNSEGYFDDEFFGPRITEKALQRCESVINKLPKFENMEVFPNNFTGVSVIIDDYPREIGLDFGDDTFGYYIEVNNKLNSIKQFKDYTEENINELINALQ